ncbi:hypothetical protein FRC08_000047 [Ceratobasidium sp. 394]|nr:hypothetical protein FRC08_000047 [Ceratobasidium sp. 394]
MSSTPASPIAAPHPSKKLVPYTRPASEFHFSGRVTGQPKLENTGRNRTICFCKYFFWSFVIILVLIRLDRHALTTIMATLIVITGIICNAMRRIVDVVAAMAKELARSKLTL